MANSAAFLTSVLRQLGHPVPSEKELQVAMELALEQVKRDQGLDPEHDRYRVLTLETVAKK